MKKILYYIIAVFTLAIVSCQKNNLSNEQILSNFSKTPEAQIKFAEEQLKSIASEIGILTKDPEFINFIHAEVSKKFDAEYEVLIKDIQKGNKWSNQLQSSKIEEALKSFINFEGSNFFPQIYIPKLQRIEDDASDNISTQVVNSSAVSEPIVYVFYAGNAEVDSASGAEISPGYITDANGNLVYWGMVDSSYADNHEVWVYSINETVNSVGNLPCIYTPGTNNVDPNCDGDGGGGGEVPCTGVDCDPFETPTNTPIFPELGHLKTNCKIQNMAIFDGKESWLAGKSEVSIRAKLHTHNNRTEGNANPAASAHYRSNQSSNYLGIVIRKFSRKECRDKTSIFVNFDLETNWQFSAPLRDPIYCDYVIFERDIFPATLNKPKISGRVDNFQGNSLKTEDWEQYYRANQKNYTLWNDPYKTGTICSQPYTVPVLYEGATIDNVIVFSSTCSFSLVRY